MTPDKKPFFAGTYFPKKDRMGMPGLISILKSVHNTWVNEKDSLAKYSSKVVSVISESIDDDYYYSVDEITEDIFEDAFSQFKYDFDNIYGGLGTHQVPYAPQPVFSSEILAQGQRGVCPCHGRKTLDSMYSGGIYDHIGFGFCRYSTDEKWLVPHFEKMLYDNALLAIAYLETYQATKTKNTPILQKKSLLMC